MMCCVTTLFAASLGSIITVDDSGGANHTSISAAIAAASAGDVLIVEPGVYGSFVLDKELSILARAGGSRPTVTGSCEIVSISGFTLAGFELEDLFVSGASGRGRIDDCRLAPSVWLDEYVLDLANNEQLEVSRTVVHGPKGTSSPLRNGATAVRVSSSRVTFTECEFTGGQGGGAFPAFGGGAEGGDAVLARFGSQVTFAGCPLLRGGESGNCYAGLASCTNDGPAGDGLRLNGSTAWIRRDATDLVEGGVFWPDYGGVPGYAINAIQSAVVVSGVTLNGACMCGQPAPPTVVAPGGTVVTPPQSEPYLTVTGLDGAGAVKTIGLVGPNGASALLFASSAPALLNVPLLGSPLWFALPALVVVPLSTTGAGNPVTIPLTMPGSTGIEGFALELQAVFPGIQDTLAPTKLFASNPAILIVRP